MTRIVDLTHPVSPETPVHPLDMRPRLAFALSHDKDGMALSNMHLSAHTGTHMDAPYHMLADGATLGEFPVSRFVGTGVVLDLRGRGPALTREDVELATAAAGGLQTGDFALLWTGWDAHFEGPDQLRHPYLTAESAAFLRDAGVTLVGSDISSMDSDMAFADAGGAGLDAGVEGMAFPAHLTLMGANMLIVENLRGLEELVGRRVQCAFLPLRAMGTEGSPVRAIAWVED
jgi:kynurenine formamidase